MKQRSYKFDNGLSFNQLLPLEIDNLKSRIESRKASCIIIDGGVGEGKTTIGIHVLEYFQKEQIDYKLQYAMGGDQFKKKLSLCIENNKKAIIYDEGGDFNKRGFMSSFNKFLIRVFQIYRTFGILVIIILPSFNQLDSGLFHDGIPRLLIHCFSRKRTFGRFSVYSLWRMYYLIDKMKRLTCPREAYSHVKPNSYGCFYNLPPKREAELDKISSHGKFKELTMADIKQQKLLTYQDIMKQSGLKYDRVRFILTEKNIKPELKYKTRVFYNSSVLDIFSNRKKR